MHLSQLTSNQRRGVALLLSAVTVMLTAGCAVIDQSSGSEEPVHTDREFRSAEAKECVNWFAKLDEAIQAVPGIIEQML